MTPTLTLRHESAEDAPRIRAVVEAAFGRASEADLVDALRRADALTISTVAELGGRLVGQIAFSPVTVGASPALAMAPVAVTPDRQRQGVGTGLIRWSLAECRRLGHEVVIVLGEPAYYHRFGFTTAAPLGIEAPFPAPVEAFMVLELTPGAMSGCRGRVTYRPEFGLV